MSALNVVYVTGVCVFLIKLASLAHAKQDFNFDGTKVLSCGMDHALKIWELDIPRIQKAIKDSHDFQRTAKK